MPSEVSYLRCEYLSNPQGICTAKPRFSWEIVDSRRQVRQVAYRVLVASDPGKLDHGLGDLWDSGKVKSDETLHIEYNGALLDSGTSCYWKVFVWVKAGKGTEEKKESLEAAEFSIGLLEETDWKAHWITAPEYIQDTPVHIGYMSLETPDPLEEKWVQIDLGFAQKLDAIQLHAAVGRRGIRPDGGETSPKDGFPVRFKVEVSDDESFQFSQLIVDRSAEDISPELSLKLEFAEVSARYVRLTSLKQIEDMFMGKSYCLKLAELEVLSSSRNIALGCQVTALDSYENAQEGFGAALLTDGKTAYDAGNNRLLRPAPLFRTEFYSSQTIRRVMVYATALGLYQLYINGTRVGDHCLAPGFTQYKKRVAVQAYNVTSLLQEGSNAIGAVLGDGWYRTRYRLDGYDQFKDYAEGTYGDAIPRLLVQMEIDYEDGSRKTVNSDASWTYTMEGPYRKTSMYDGTWYDARLEQAGWQQPGFDTSSWSPVEVSPVPWTLILWPQTVQPIRRIREYPVKTVRELSPKVWLYDFGQSLGGVCRVTLDGPAGMVVKLRHIPELNADGSLYTNSLWGAYNNGDRYILNGTGPQTFEASFNFHGFRYVEVTGLDSLANILDINAVLIADDYPEVSSFKSSDKRLDQLWSNILLTYQACMKSVLVDVCDRDERWPWLGDCFTTHSQSLPFMLDVSAHFARRTNDMQDEKSKEGFFYATAPRMGLITPAAGWSDAAVTASWSSYVNYGNTRLLHEMYPALLKYLLAIHKNYDNGVPLLENCWSDHLASNMTIRPGAKSWDEKGPERLSIWHYERLSLLQINGLILNMAVIVGDLETAASIELYGKKLRQEFVSAKLAEDTAVAGQTLYGMMLSYGVVQPEEKSTVLARLLQAIEDYDGYFTTGTPTTNALLKVLSDNGHHELAYNMTMRPEAPSFGHMIDYGSTIVWERLDSYVAGLGFNPDFMNGFIHSGFNSIAEWMFQSFGGIRPDECFPAYKQVRIEPFIAGPVDNVRTSYRSVRGIISCEWSKNAYWLTLKVEVPANTSATVIIPIFGQAVITEGGMAAEEATGVKLISLEETLAEYQIESGSYLFHSR